MKAAFAVAGVLLALLQAASAEPVSREAEPVIGKVMVASHILRVSANIERNTQSTTSLPIKEFYFFYGGIVRLSWQFKSNGTNTASAFVLTNYANPTTNLWNGTPCESSTQSATYVVVKCDIAVSASTRLEIMLKSGDGSSVWIRNAHISYNLVNVTKPAVAAYD